MTLKVYVKKEGSVEAAGRALGIPARTLHRWLKGDFNPSAAYVRLLAVEGVTP